MARARVLWIAGLSLVLSAGCSAGGAPGAAEPKEAIERLFAAAKHRDSAAVTRLSPTAGQLGAVVRCEPGAAGRLATALSQPAGLSVADILHVDRINIDGSTERNIRFAAGDSVDRGCVALKPLELLDTQLVYEPRDQHASPRATFVRLDDRWYILSVY